ncbi:cyclase family protein [Candidatus Roizmanbacteria bacterium]|nr:cyclase family protein [Candidatus Roizmanbacteria bacterium]
MKLIDLTHTFSNRMPVYPGDPSPQIDQITALEKDGYNDHQITTVMHVGTHIDAPFHMIAGGKTMDQMPAEIFFGKGILIDARSKKTIDANLLENIHILPGSIVLIYTGFGEKYREEGYFKNIPDVSEAFAKKMVEYKVKIVGMDILGPDAPPFPTHKILLGHEILIIENLTNLDKLVGLKKFEVIALPMKIQTDAAPVRVIVRLE